MQLDDVQFVAKNCCLIFMQVVPGVKLVFQIEAQNQGFGAECNKKNGQKESFFFCLNWGE